MEIHKLIPIDDSSDFITEDFINLFYSYKDVVLEDNEYYNVNVTPVEAFNFRCDLRGLLHIKRIPTYLHLLVLILNGIKNFESLDVNILTLKIPHENYVRKLSYLLNSKNN